MVMLEKMAKKRKPNFCLAAKQNSKHTTRPIRAALEDRHFPTGLKVPSYLLFSEEQANIMQTKLCMKRSMI